jgi:hypothetical protein
MNWRQVEQLLSDCTKQPGQGIVPPTVDLGDYAEFAAKYDSVEGFVSQEQYLMLWSVHQIPELNQAYNVAEFLPGVILIGTDGADTGFGRDLTTGRYVSVPLVGMSRKCLSDMGASFEEFLVKLSGHRML